jgi:hypothetical protein
MAGSSSRGTRSAGSRRGPPARGGGGGNNATAMGVAVILVVGVVAAIIVMNSGKDKKPSTVPTPPPVVQSPPTKPDVPKKPERGPPPALSKDVIASARERVKTFPALAEKGRALLDEAQNAKRADDQDLWQQKLGEAQEYFSQIKEEWNEVIAQMPSNKEWDEEEVANHYLGAESSQVSKLLEPLEGLTKALRPK